MGDLLDKLNKNAEKAKGDNKELEKERDELSKTRDDLEESIKDMQNDETRH